MTCPLSGTNQPARAKGKCIFDCGRLNLFGVHACSFVFIEFPNSEIAALAVALMHGVPFGAKHQLKVNYFDDIEKYASLDTAYVEPELEEFQPKVEYEILVYI